MEAICDQVGRNIVLSEAFARHCCDPTVQVGSFALRGITGERAIATRNGGSPLVWSPEFLGQLPSSAGLHPSAFAWLNAKGALGLLSSLTSNPAINELMASRDPLLVVFDGTPEQIHASSRTRISGLIMDVMLLQNLGQATAGQQ